MKHIGKRVGTVLLCGCLFLTGCGKEKLPVPELVKPVASNEACRPVEYGTIGNIENYTGFVRPTEHCFFWEQGAAVSEICVNEGDYVKKGDVLARADINLLKEQLEELKKQRALNVALYDISQEEYIYSHHQLEYDSTYSWFLHQSDMVKKIAKSIAELEENNRFDQLLHEFELKELDKSIAALEKQIREGTLISDVNGYVSYRRDISESRYVDSSVNVVVVADPSERYIELNKDISLPRNGKPAGILTAFAYIGEGKYELEEIKYSNAELVAMENKREFAPFHFRLKDAGKMPEIGEEVAVTLGYDLLTDVCVIGNDSLYQDNFGEYVYVDNQGKKELRRVKLGQAGPKYSQVLSGLEIGERVYYSAAALLPTEGEATVPERDDTGMALYMEIYENAGIVKSQYFSEYEGIVKEIAVESGTYVEKGDLICSIRTDMGSARLTQLKNQLTDMQLQYESMQKGYEEQLKSIEKMKKENEHAMLVELTQISRQYMAGQSGGSEDDGSAGDESEDQTEGIPDPEAGEGDENQGEMNPPGVSPMTPEEFDKQVEDTKTLYGLLEKSIEKQEALVKADRKKTELNHQYEKAKLDKEIADANRNNDGKGLVHIYADESGIVVYKNLVKDLLVEMGDGLFSIQEKRKNMISFLSIANIPIGHTVELVTINNKVNAEQWDSEEPPERVPDTVHYTGKIVATSGEDRVYVTSTDTNTFLTHSENQTSHKRYYVEIDDPDFALDDQKYTLKFYEELYKNMLLLPRGAVYWDNNYEYRYVWRIVGEDIVMQYVNVSGVDGDYRLYVLDGLTENDKYLFDVDWMKKEVQNHAIIY